MLNIHEVSYWWTHWSTHTKGCRQLATKGLRNSAISFTKQHCSGQNICVRANKSSFLLIAEGQWMQTPSPPPILSLPDAGCEALKHNYTAEVSVIHTCTQSITQTPGVGRTLRIVVPGVRPLQGVWIKLWLGDTMPRETEHKKRDKQRDSTREREWVRKKERKKERHRIVSEWIKNAWLCSSWRNNECPHSLPVTSGSSWDRVEKWEKERTKAKKRGHQQFTAGSHKGGRRQTRTTGELWFTEVQGGRGDIKVQFNGVMADK